MSTQRSIDCVPGEAICAKPDTDGPFSCNLSIENQGIVDDFFCEKSHSYDKV